MSAPSAVSWEVPREVDRLAGFGVLVHRGRRDLVGRRSSAFATQGVRVQAQVNRLLAGGVDEAVVRALVIEASLERDAILGPQEDVTPAARSAAAGSGTGAGPAITLL